MLQLPAQEYRRHVDRVKAAMAEARLDTLIAFSSPSSPGPVEYLAGYETSLGLFEFAVFVINAGAGRECTLITNEYWDEGGPATWIPDVIVSRSNLAVELSSIVPASARRVGIAGYELFPAWVLDALRSAHPEADYSDASELVKLTAMIKSPVEVEFIRRAARISDAGCQRFLDVVEEGLEERSIEQEVDQAMGEAGSEGNAFRTFIMSGPRIAVGIGFAQERRLVRGDQVNMLCGARVGGYRVEIGRVTAIDPISPESRHWMEAAAGVHEAMLASMHPGGPVAGVAQAGMDAARQMHVDDHIWVSPATGGTPNFGHGMGCWYAEPPSLKADAASELQAGMILSLEARLSVSGVGGAVLSEMILVTDSGAERLSRLPLRTWA